MLLHNILQDGPNLQSLGLTTGQFREESEGRRERELKCPPLVERVIQQVQA